jgi:predicted helicase
VLHHPEYRERYAANLKRELPRIPFIGTQVAPGFSPAISEAKESRALAPEGDSTSAAKAAAPQQHLPAGLKPCATDSEVFWEFVKAGRRLAEIHVEYEKQPEYPLERVENPKEKLNWRVEKMRLSKDKSVLVYNEFLTLKGIPPEVQEYRLGNRSALEWVVDQYQVSKDKRSGIVNDPNREDDPEYIARLIGQVVTVSLETVRIVKGLPELVISTGTEAEKAAT